MAARSASKAFSVIGAREEKELYTDVVEHVSSKMNDEKAKSKVLSIDEVEKLVAGEDRRRLAERLLDLLDVAAEAMMTASIGEENEAVAKKNAGAGVEKETEACFAVLASVIAGLQRKVSVEMSEKAAEVVVAKYSHEQQCVGALLCLLNASPYDEAKLAVLTVLVRYANDAGKAAASEDATTSGGATAGERIAALLCSAPLRSALAGWASSLRRGNASFGVDMWRRLLEACAVCLSMSASSASSPSGGSATAAVRAREAAAIRALFLATFEECEDTRELEQAVSVAADALIAILKAPECLLPSPAPAAAAAAAAAGGNSASSSPASPPSHVVDMMGMRAVRQLEQPCKSFPTVKVRYQNAAPSVVDPHALYIVVRTMCAGNFKVFKEVVIGEKSTVKVLADVGIAEADALDTMRLIALANLPKNVAGVSSASGAAVGAHELSYADVAAALEIEGDGEIEAWIVRAVREGLLEAKLDQMKKVITVTKQTQCSFESDDWLLLQQRLNAWKEGVASSSVALLSDAAPKTSLDVTPPAGIGAI